MIGTLLCGGRKYLFNFSTRKIQYLIVRITAIAGINMEYLVLDYKLSF